MQPARQEAKIALNHSSICPDWKNPMYCPKYELATAEVRPIIMASKNFPRLKLRDWPG